MQFLKETDDHSGVEWTQAMGHLSTVRASARFAGALLLLTAWAGAQFPTLRPAWRRIGNSSLATGLSSNAGGPVEKVWFQPDGVISVRLPGGQSYSTADLESWRTSTASPPADPPAAPPAGAIPPEPGALLRPARSGSPVVYAASRHVWRSGDGGLNWQNLTLYRGQTILGGPVTDLAVDPTDEQRLAVAGATGVWFSSDGGASWQGLNDGLPSLPVRRILAAPQGVRGVRIAVAQPGGLGEFEWAPAQHLGWMAYQSTALETERAALAQLSAALGSRITAVAATGDAVYAGDSTGRLYASLDAGRSWRAFPAAPNSGRVERFWLDPADRSFALAALSSQQPGAPRILRTLNAGAYWDDLSSNLPDGPAYGIAADRATGAIYAATARGVFLTYGDLRAPAPATSWLPLPAGLPNAAVRDVRLDDPANTLLAAVDGYGVYAILAPHRSRNPQLAHSADYAARPAAPGALLSIIGARAASVTAGSTASPILTADDDESQIQVPFEVSGESLQLVVNSTRGRLVFGLPLRSAAPAILIDPDGTPMVLDAASGAQLDILHPARPGSTLQILMSGLGRVQPDWPTGLAAPLEDAPRVTTPLRAALDGVPLHITRATLAPGYIGYYLVEVELPELLDSGASELVVEASGIPSNRVRVYVGP
jgi:uncharacterized protein (TIGR03437 family)